jgi:hypothetical protein
MSGCGSAALGHQTMNNCVLIVSYRYCIEACLLLSWRVHISDPRFINVSHRILMNQLFGSCAAAPLHSRTANYTSWMIFDDNVAHIWNVTGMCQPLTLHSICVDYRLNAVLLCRSDAHHQATAHFSTLLESVTRGFVIFSSSLVRLGWVHLACASSCLRTLGIRACC